MSPCPSCGNPRSPTTRFCATCGLPVEPPSATPAAASSVALAATAEASPLPTETTAAPGTLVDNKYVITRVLGEGGMGIVYLARDRNIGIDVVLKSVRAELAHRADVRERTLSEGQALARIDHPNVVRFNAVIVDGGKLWLVMQYIEGESLEARIERHNRAGRGMPLGEALALFRQVVSGVRAAHDEGLIHRDLKPANVLIRAKDGVAKVSDFGIAKTEGDASSGKGVTRGIIGSLWYMSPEQVRGRRDLDKRVDVYALGILLYEMLTGRVPFDADSEFELMRLQAEAPMPPVTTLRPDVPAALDALLARATAKDRETRYATCDELIEALEAFEGATPWPHAVAGANAGTSGSATVMTPPPPFAARAGVGIETPRPYAHAGPLQGSTTAGHALPPIPAPSAHSEDEPSAAHAGPSSLKRLGFTLGALGLLAAGVMTFLTYRSRGELNDNAKAQPSAATSDAAPTAAPSPAGSAQATSKGPLADLVGAWRTVDTQRDLDAVLVGDVVEFRVVDAEQFGAETYRSGDVRFRVAVAPTDKTVLQVMDQPRVLPPNGKTMAPQARPTCVAMVDRVEGRPLLARLQSDGLEVEFARLEPKLGNFTVEGSRITSCVGLDALPVSRLPAIRLMRR